MASFHANKLQQLKTQNTEESMVMVSPQQNKEEFLRNVIQSIKKPVKSDLSTPCPEPEAINPV
jgi:hypothetical protein